jgi:GTP-binding protein
VLIGKPGSPPRTAKISELFIFDNLGRKQVDQVSAGDIVMFSGVDDIMIGETLMGRENPEPLEPIAVEEPTVRMTVSVNTSPLGGKEGKLLTRLSITSHAFKQHLTLLLTAV